MKETKNNERESHAGDSSPAGGCESPSKRIITKRKIPERQRRATIVSIDMEGEMQPTQLTDLERAECQKLMDILTSSGVPMTRSELVATLRLLDLRLSPSVIDQVFELVDADKDSTISLSEFVCFMEYIKGIHDSEQWCATLLKLEFVLSESYNPRDESTEKVRQIIKAQEDSYFSKKSLVNAGSFTSVLYYIVVSPLHVATDNLYGNWVIFFMIWEGLLTLFLFYNLYCEYSRVLIDDLVRKHRIGISLISAVPIDLIGHATGVVGIQVVGYGVRLVQVLKLQWFFDLEKAVLVTRGSVRSAYGWYPIVKLVLYTACGIHLLACLHVMCSCEEGDCNITLEKYDISIYWSLYTISSVGYGDVPVDNQRQRFLADVCFIFAIILNGILVGKITSFMMLDTTGEHRQLMHTTMQVIAHYHLPGSVTDDILSLQHHLLSQKIRLKSVIEVVNHLPPIVQESMSIYIKVESLSRLPIFHTTSIRCKVALAECLHAKIVNRDLAIVIEGDIGDAMYFIAHGYATVSIKGEQLATLGRGAFFGELTLLTTNRRAATVKTASLCEVLILESADFQVITQRFPTLKWHIEAVVHKRMGSLPANNNSSIAQIPTPLEECTPFIAPGDAVQERVTMRRLDRIVQQVQNPSSVDRPHRNRLLSGITVSSHQSGVSRESEISFKLRKTRNNPRIKQSVYSPIPPPVDWMSASFDASFVSGQDDSVRSSAGVVEELNNIHQKLRSVLAKHSNKKREDLSNDARDINISVDL